MLRLKVRGTEEEYLLWGRKLAKFFRDIVVANHEEVISLIKWILYKAPRKRLVLPKFTLYVFDEGCFKAINATNVEMYIDDSPEASYRVVFLYSGRDVVYKVRKSIISLLRNFDANEVASALMIHTTDRYLTDVALLIDEATLIITLADRRNIEALAEAMKAVIREKAESLRKLVNIVNNIVRRISEDTEPEGRVIVTLKNLER